MMPLAERLTFTVPLSGADFKLAQKFSSEQKNADKSQQVFLNTLAVLAVNFYCQCLKVETNLEESTIGHYNRRILMDSADLKIDVLGKLECRPVLPNENICYVPSEVWSDRVGYVVVEIDEEAKKAILVGFVEQIKTNELPLAQLPDIDNLVDLLLLAKNKQFLERIFANNWNEKESAKILKDKQESFVCLDNPALPTIDKSITSPFYKAKYITLRGRKFILFVRITPTKEGKFQLVVEVRSYRGEKIPSDLNLKLLSLSDQTLKANLTKGGDYISLEYTLQLGESFQIQVKRAEEIHTEQFSFD
ncbi:MAG: DUF1822 family protein [Microcystis panniformis Mp_MB_F_20051200_S9]|uniref:DUF1822 family protein n=1 Tax=Microcystis panniformis Mp_MB_F_20051200_S9 TaxID=2486223 RepID=A0A552PYX8_9CHRO|nr:MAG: DUF1822 family protein [Microcystis panniformis Mp_GB_SS_20050300_S99D]TRV49382.1 MAG: DUF1822 family protein [Microcystis panniformis Mp_MB_F_20080800_S26D]TRV52803.1 MAG: DUF1822 family protein [Microcystis panniformis Mp_GB_SS_20050300_S99]TRV57723.1 MAG: DUF1822 family protein [Microcystis panniformis Mp_MB_F_20080800_S26]TRV62139.1 MAG: DUF1822 family protein [Microcystis panniformis Mp_MB_F_20051200_S9]TRV65590.1 MAG: DUF1822 family protein [Microcystis panniformis Mp_MB_F_200512